MDNLDKPAQKLMEWNNPFGVCANDRNHVGIPEDVEITNEGAYKRKFWEPKTYGGPSSSKYTLSSPRFEETMSFETISSFYAYEDCTDSAKHFAAKLGSAEGQRVMARISPDLDPKNPQDVSTHMGRVAANNLGVEVKDLSPEITQSIYEATGFMPDIEPAPAALRAAPSHAQPAAEPPPRPEAPLPKTAPQAPAMRPETPAAPEKPFEPVRMRAEAPKPFIAPSPRVTENLANLDFGQAFDFKNMDFENLFGGILKIIGKLFGLNIDENMFAPLTQSVDQIKSVFSGPEPEAQPEPVVFIAPLLPDAEPSHVTLDLGNPSDRSLLRPDQDGNVVVIAFDPHWNGPVEREVPLSDIEELLGPHLNTAVTRSEFGVDGFLLYSPQGSFMMPMDLDKDGNGVPMETVHAVASTAKPPQPDQPAPQMAGPLPGVQMTARTAPSMGLG